MGTLARSFRPDTPYPEFIAQLNNYTKTLDNQNRFEIITQGESSVPDLAVTATGAGWFTDHEESTVTHNLGFAPICQAFILVAGIRIPLNYIQSATNSATLEFYTWAVTVRTDATTLRFRSDATIKVTAGGFDVNFETAPIKYYLLRAPAGAV